MSKFSKLPSGLRLRGSDLQGDPAFEPTEIHKVWSGSRGAHLKDTQEDAEEFLSFILNKLNDEMVEVCFSKKEEKNMNNFCFLLFCRLLN